MTGSAPGPADPGAEPVARNADDQLGHRGGRDLDRSAAGNHRGDGRDPGLPPAAVLLQPAVAAGRGPPGAARADHRRLPGLATANPPRRLAHDGRLRGRAARHSLAVGAP